MQFVSIDVETANANMATICQIGAARFVNGELADEWQSYVDPEDYFDVVNVSIHGIDEATVAHAPNFHAVVAELDRILSDRVVVSHTHFDRVALHQAAARYNVAPPSYIWLDTARVARRTWSAFAVRGYGLSNVCKELGYQFRHHDALEDAKAAGQILLAAMRHSGLGLDEWLTRVRQPIDLSKASSSSAVKRQGNAAGPLHGEVIVFTGALKIPRREAADLAARLGCQVAANVTKNTTLLVVGDQDVKRLAGYTKSNKHRRAEELILAGQHTRILQESDFRELVEGFE